MRTLTFVLLAALFAAPHAARAASPALVHIERSSVTVWGYETSQERDWSGNVKIETSELMPLCSGVTVAIQDANATHVRIATAGHCNGTDQEDGATVTVQIEHVQFFDGDIGAVDAITQSDTDDLAVLDVHTRRSHYDVAVPSAPPARGQTLLVFGTPQGEFWSLQSARSMNGSMYDATFGPLWEHTYLLECAACAGGDSGGGTWTQDGKFVGILVAGSPGQILVIGSERLAGL